MFIVLSSSLRVIARVHPVHVMSAEQRQTADDFWTKPRNLCHRPACRRLWNYRHHRYLLLRSQKADTHFTIPQRVDGWVDLDGWLHTQMGYLPAGEQSLIQVVRAQCRLATYTLIEANALTN